AHRSDSPWHDAAKRCLIELIESGVEWAIPWPCLHEFLSISTHPAIFDPPTPLESALAQVDAWLEAPSIVLLGEASGYWEALRTVLTDSKIVGPVLHDARIATICRQHDAELWSAGRDFARFAGLRVRNPLLPEQISERASRYGRKRRRG